MGLVLPSCGSPVVSALLPVFLAVPISLMVLFEVELLDKMRALTQPDEDGNIPRIGRAVLYVRNMATKTVDMHMGTAQVAQATQDTQSASENDGSEERRGVVIGGLSETEVELQSSTVHETASRDHI